MQEAGNIYIYIFIFFNVERYTPTLQTDSRSTGSSLLCDIPAGGAVVVCVGGGGGHRWMFWLSVIIAEVSDELSRRCISYSGSKRSKRGSNINQMIHPWRKEKKNKKPKKSMRGFFCLFPGLI